VRLDIAGAGTVSGDDDGDDTANEVDVLGIELELRRIVGVVSARVEHPSGGEPLAISVAVVGSTSGVVEGALAAARPYFEGAVEVEVLEISPPAAAEGSRLGERVRLLGVYAGPEESPVEVHVAHGGRQAVGRSADRRLTGVARATMEALRALGADVPFEVSAITNLDPAGSGPVLVRLISEDGSIRLGVVAAEDEHQATVRALLHALNRHLERAFDPDGGDEEEAEEPVFPALAG
jgi:hypothetical protein